MICGINKYKNMIMTIVPSLHISYYMVTKVGFYSLAIQYTCTIQTTTPHRIPRTYDMGLDHTSEIYILTWVAQALKLRNKFYDGDVA